MAVVEAGREEDVLEGLTTYVFSYSDEEMAAFEVLPRADGDQYTARLAQRPLAGTRYATLMDQIRDSKGRDIPGVETWSVLTVIGPEEMTGVDVNLVAGEEIVAVAFPEQDRTDSSFSACMFVAPPDSYVVDVPVGAYRATVEIGEATFYELILSY